jgi:hypothetical protein
MLPSFIKFTLSPRSNNEESVTIKETPLDVVSLPETVASSDETSCHVETSSVVSALSDVLPPSCGVKWWDKKSRFADHVRDGLHYLKRDDSNVVMLFESPSSANAESSFYNCQVYRFHDYPPVSNAYKNVLGPCRYSLMNGDAYPSYLEAGAPPFGLLEHWETTVPGFVRPNFVQEIPDDAHVYAYLPCESIVNHVNDPHVHYHMAGKDALCLMSNKSTKMLSCTKTQRPCIVKTTHSMGSKGIFIIHNDQDEAEFHEFLKESGNPTYVITELVEIDRNVACHFFVHPSGEVTWFGSNENYREADGRWSMDSYQVMADQEELKELQLPYVRDVAQYCQSLGFWGFCGIDVLFDKNGKGYLVDVNPRVTGSLPSLMVAQLFQEKYGFEYCMFRRNGNITYHGSAQQLLDEVARYNQANEGFSKIVLFGIYQESEGKTKINIGVYGNDMEKCKAVLNRFAKANNL